MLTIFCVVVLHSPSCTSSVMPVLFLCNCLDLFWCLSKCTQSSCTKPSEADYLNTDDNRTDSKYSFFATEQTVLGPVLHGPVTISIFTPNFFHTSKYDLFDLRNPKIQIWQVPSQHIIPNPKWTRRAQKILNQSSSWPSNCCTHTFETRCLQVLWFGSLEPNSRNPPQIT